MLLEEENNINNTEQSEPLLNENKPVQHEIALWKRIVLFLVGLAGIFVIGIFVGLLTFFAPEELRDPITNLVTYAVLFVSLIAIVLVDIPHYLATFKKWQSYLMGLAVGIGIIVFDMIYTTILVSCYPDYTIGGNETAVRGVIDVYPFWSVLILGIVGPICEEITYRIGLFGSLRKVNRILAYVVSTIVFALIHFRFNAPNIYVELANFPAYFVSGLALAFAYDKWGFTGSMTAHIANNLYAVMASIIVKYIH